MRKPKILYGYLFGVFALSDSKILEHYSNKGENKSNYHAHNYTGFIVTPNSLILCS